MPAQRTHQHRARCDQDVSWRSSWWRVNHTLSSTLPVRQPVYRYSVLHAQQLNKGTNSLWNRTASFSILASHRTFPGHSDSSTGPRGIPPLQHCSACPLRATFYLVMIYSSRPTLQLGLENFPTGLGGCDSGGAGCIHERSPQHARPVLLARGQIALPPSLEVILALSYRRNQTLN